jgi:hypothetical protein
LALIPDTRLGVFDISGQIGEGGSGGYRATDTSLGRQVAIKVLPDAFAADADRLAGFEREANTGPPVAWTYAGTTTYSAHELDAGTGCLSSMRPSMCSWMASYIRRSVSSRADPVATHPGRSGEYAEKLLPALSMTIRNRCMTLATLGGDFLPAVGLDQLDGLANLGHRIILS